MHTCPMVSPGPVPHIGGPILPPCAPTVLTGGLPQARISDLATCAGPPDVIAKGSAGVFVMGMPAARMGDLTAHGGVIIVGLPTVLIGEVGMGMATPQMSGILPLGVEGQGGDSDATAKALAEAAKQGVPFCEQCQKGA